MPRTYTLHAEAAAAPEVEIDFSTALNPQQFEAVTSPPGQALVIAGAGSGKTRTLTYRVAYLIANAISAENILLLTFTNKAAREMLERVNGLVPGQAASVWGGTFHSVGNRLLRRHADLLGFTRSFSILDSDDQKSLLTKIINAGGYAAEGEVPPGKKRGRRKGETGFPKAPVVGGIISLATNTCRSVDDVIRERYAYFEEMKSAIREVAALYARKKKESNSMDFDDLLALTVQLLRNQEGVRRYYQRQFQFILVDEYQDTNALQGEFIEVLAGENGNLMVVGDDAQSIYSWRGANFENILKFPQRHRAAQVYKIETNYRSVPEVLALANESILANQRQFRKVLRPDRASRGMRPALVALDNPQVQAAFVSQRLRELHEREGIAWRDMAVLYRAHFQSMDVQMQLTQDRIPFLITSGLRFFEQAHVKDVVSFLKWAANPHDEVSFDRMVRLLPGIGAGAAGKLWLEWAASGADGVGVGGIGVGGIGVPPMSPTGLRPVENPTDETSLEPIGGPPMPPETPSAMPPASFSSILGKFRKVPARAQSGWRQLGHVLDEFIDSSAPRGFQRPDSLLTSVIEGLYDDYLKENFDNARERRQDLDQLQIFAERFSDLDQMLAELALLTNADDASPRGTESRPPKQGDNAVALTSVHQAKGLEWRAVFLIWLTEGMFPNSRVVEEAGLEGLEEERRLFYVAVTRAMDQLYLCYPKYWPKSFSDDPWQQPSSLLGDFSPDRVEPWRIRGW